MFANLKFRLIHVVDISVARSALSLVSGDVRGGLNESLEELYDVEGRIRMGIRDEVRTSLMRAQPFV